MTATRESLWQESEDLSAENASDDAETLPAEIDPDAWSLPSHAPSKCDSPEAARTQDEEETVPADIDLEMMRGTPDKIFTRGNWKRKLSLLEVSSAENIIKVTSSESEDQPLSEGEEEVPDEHETRIANLCKQQDLQERWQRKLEWRRLEAQRIAADRNMQHWRLFETSRMKAEDEEAMKRVQYEAARSASLKRSREEEERQREVLESLRMRVEDEVERKRLRAIFM